ncbi:hypothetical protein K2Q16_01200 [Patescibacteria group bacterium]|nr:hypothetical protein [Patescibacteria group bacterium]
MINLIPPEARSRILVEYWVRVVTAWLSLLAIAATVVGALLFPAYVLVTSQVKSSAAEADKVRARVAELDTTTKVLDSATEEARMIVAAAQEPVLTEVVAIVEGLLPTGVEVSAYSLARLGAGVAPVVVRGTATTRSALASFREGLVNHPKIVKVDLPISNFAKDRDLIFTVTLTMSSTTPAL